ncbi:hypothetical protein CEXT_219411 [Caerostris extrusa]|uniref:Uncharacterized protein n=1 Tax=Caerostris extrusa TaxID=172846 RepID=A0AAV4WJP7_CAEEX|nr:hypothetical protein CEXT_219411 [Caerostris extrusa]
MDESTISCENGPRSHNELLESMPHPIMLELPYQGQILPLSSSLHSFIDERDAPVSSVLGDFSTNIDTNWWIATNSERLSHAMLCKNEICSHNELLEWVMHPIGSSLKEVVLRGFAGIAVIPFVAPDERRDGKKKTPRRYVGNIFGESVRFEDFFLSFIRIRVSFYLKLTALWEGGGYKSAVAGRIMTFPGISQVLDDGQSSGHFSSVGR